MMSYKTTCLLFISLLVPILVISQEVKEEQPPIKVEKHLFVGVDLFGPVLSMFSHKKNVNGYISYTLDKRLVGVVELGYDKNIYRKNGWDVEAKGLYGEIGVNYILTDDYEKTGEGFFIGARIGFSPYKQTIKAFPIRVTDDAGKRPIIGYGSLPEDNVSAGWIEPLAGAKVQIGNTPLYVDVMFRPKFVIFSKKQEGIDNLVIPGYGKDKGVANMSIYWGISYRLD